MAGFVKDRFEKPGSQSRKDMLVSRHVTSHKFWIVLTENCQGSWIQHGVSQEECEAEGLLAIIAGSETTASVMRITFMCLLTSPPTYQKLKTVVKDAVSSGDVSNPISFESAKEIPYLRVRMFHSCLPKTPC